ncbi:MAG: YfcL family protein [Marinobacterium sp.]
MIDLKRLSEQLLELEAVSLDNPDQLFAISYIRGHIDLLHSQDAELDQDKLVNEIAESFKTDKMSETDQTLVLELLKSF